ncbi:helix-turn-helix domain-containing protein [Streptomyces sp. H27-D2]|uniref:helix-turn-helix domain-containing protein n=1 Tax=Streptomyces sp. H27-D2 TaxID=3046304 RepID=UPI002DB7CA41|nr:helix-turn-helix transcriptional regulator [Streptomyces sp. H27-D2]MEC4016986.1 helix-turn-helix transcriptional regulator [Streptomyces sp. H27-D2]
MNNWKKPRKNASAVRLIGAQLALFRKVAHLTQRELADRVRVHEETIASIEQGRRPLKPDLAEELDNALETKGALAVAVANLPELDRFPVWAAEFMDREAEAIALASYENQVLPGLLQTEGYARAVFRSRIPILSEGEIERQVTDRIERQGLLHRDGRPTISFVIAEAVLMDRLGGPAVFEEQRQHLRTCADLPGLSLQVMPCGRWTHAALDGPFVLLETSEHDHLAYAETQRGSQLISDPGEVSILAQRYAMLRTQALNPEDTKTLLDRALGER